MRALRWTGYAELPYYAGGVAVLLLGWTLVSASLDNRTLLPPPIVVSRTLVEVFLEGDLVRHTVASTRLAIVGFLVAAVTAIPLGVALVLSPVVRWVVEPFVELLRPIPAIAWIPISLLAFGTGAAGRLFIVWIAAYIPILFNTVRAVHDVPPAYVGAARTLGASRRFVLFHVIIPGSIPFVVTGLRLGFGSAWRLVLAAELLAAQEGLGFMIADAREVLRVDIVLVGVAVIGFVGYTFAKLFIALERWSLRYKRTVAEG